MTGNPKGRSGYFERLFDAVPIPVFIVDPDIRIVDFNSAALALFSGGKEAVILKRGGEALDCLNARETPGGCGRSPHCGECVIRNSVGEAIRSGKVHRVKTRMELHHGGEIREVHFLVTASFLALESGPHALLILEDVGEIVRLQGIVPICACCKKIRTGENYWEAVEAYVSARSDVMFSHSLCEECAEKEFPGIGRAGKARGPAAR